MHAPTTNRIILAMMWCVVLIGVPSMSLGVDARSFMPVALPCALMAGLAAYCRARGLTELGDAAENFAMIVAALCGGILLSYLAAGSGAPMADARLYALDRWLGFDWWRYLAFFDAHPLFARSMHLIYLSMIVQVIAAAVALSFNRDRTRTRVFFGAVMLSLTMVCAISLLTPAVGIYGLLRVDLGPYSHLHPTTTFEAVAPLARLRAGTFAIVRLQDSVGLISFPSFHCAAGVLLIWAGARWRAGRWPVALWNIAMIASTPVEGAHYLVDMIAGAAVAMLALMLVTRIGRAAGAGHAIGASSATAAGDAFAAGRRPRRLPVFN